MSTPQRLVTAPRDGPAGRPARHRWPWVGGATREGGDLSSSHKVTLGQESPHPRHRELSHFVFFLLSALVADEPGDLKVCGAVCHKAPAKGPPSPPWVSQRAVAWKTHDRWQAAPCHDTQPRLPRRHSPGLLLCRSSRFSWFSNYSQSWFPCASSAPESRCWVGSPRVPSVEAGSALPSNTAQQRPGP